MTRGIGRRYGCEMYDVKTGKVLFIEGKYEQAREYFYGAATEGDAESAFDYGYMLLNGIGGERDEASAASFFKLASHRVGEACYNLAVMYLHGVGVKRDYRLCYSYMHDAAEMDIIEAQLYLGVAHTMGALYEPDIIAISLLPYHIPQYRDPYALLDGDVPDMEDDEEKRSRAVRLDLRSAFEWFGAAARHDEDYVEELSQKGKYLFARCFLDGVGTDFNRDVANRLMLAAAADGSVDAVSYIQTDAPYLLADPKNRDIVRRIEQVHGPALLGGK